jgi:hypothetical protein
MVADAGQQERTGNERDQEEIAPRSLAGRDFLEKFARTGQGQPRPRMETPALLKPSGPGPHDDSARTRKKSPWPGVSAGVVSVLVVSGPLVSTQTAEPPKLDGLKERTVS